MVCSNGYRCFPSLPLGLTIPGLAAIARYRATLPALPCSKVSIFPRFNSEVAVTLLLPQHSLGEVERLLGLEGTKKAKVLDLQPTTNRLTDKEEQSGAKKPRKLKQFTLQQQVEILDELVASGGNKYRQVEILAKPSSSKIDTWWLSMLPSGLLKSTKCLGAVYNTGSEMRIRFVRVLQVVMVLDTRLVHPMKSFFHLHMINIFFVLGVLWQAT